MKDPTAVPSMFDRPAGPSYGTAGGDFEVHSLQGPEGTRIKSSGGSVWASNPANMDAPHNCD